MSVGKVLRKSGQDVTVVVMSEAESPLSVSELDRQITTQQEILTNLQTLRTRLIDFQASSDQEWPMEA